MTSLFHSAHPTPTEPPPQPILGWGLKREHSFGFHATGRSDQASTMDEPVGDAGEGHLMTIAPTGSGKGRSAIIPTLLSYPGPVIVVDPKGENYDVTARRRREMGQQVFLLDPFGITGDDGSYFNMLDTFNPAALDGYDQARGLAELITPAKMLQDPFWEDSARELITVLILHVASARPPVLQNFSEVMYLLNQSTDDWAHTIKEMRGNKLPLVSKLAAGFSETEPKVWASILSTARTATAVFNSQCFEQMSGRTEIPLTGIVRGDPISIYLVLPPEKLASHGQLLRIWIGCLLEQICKRRHRVEQPTLFLLDEAAQLGTLNQLRRAITLLRGYGVRTWSFWQDLSQLQNLYPDWQTLYNNTRYIQTFGATTQLLAESLSHLLRLPWDVDPLTLPPDQLILAEAGKPPQVLAKPDYLHDRAFHGLYDNNPFYQAPPPQPEEEEEVKLPPWRKPPSTAANGAEGDDYGHRRAPATGDRGLR